MNTASRFRVLGTVASLLALSFAAPAVQACTCLFTPIESEVENASHIFSGVSLGSHPAYDESYPDHHYEIVQVDAVWKGSVTARMEILVPNSPGLCGFTLAEGARVLVFASAYPDGPLASTTCSRTGSYDADNPIWDELGPPLTVSSSAKSWGAVKSIYR